MKFRTIIQLPEYSFRIGHRQHMLMLGSCFTENIGQKLKNHKFNLEINPFGVIYNPASVLNCLQRIQNGSPYTESELSHDGRMYFSYAHYTRFSHPDKQECLRRINQSLEAAHKQMQVSRTWLITFGTSWVFRHKDSGKIVANCHKQAAKQFNREVLEIEDIVTSWADFMAQAFSAMPGLKVLFTLSPVRHLKDGMIGNQRSKARLLIAIEKLCARFPDATYFPAYEILMDDLRDYRFYTSDLLHPDSQAVAYLWEQFGQAFFSKDTMALNRRIARINKAMAHRQEGSDIKAHQQFAKKMRTEVERLSHDNPHLDWTSEKQHFETL